MSINPLTKDIPFGVSSPPYQSRSAGTDFEDIILQIREELKALETQYTQNLLSLSDMSPEKRRLAVEQASLQSVSQLFKMDDTEFSLLDDLLMMALEDTRIAQQAKASGADENNPETLVSDRYRMNLSRISGLLAKPF